jgi:ABC-type transport system involved in multi-copper enzyme maturation permease subunit
MLPGPVFNVELLGLSRRGRYYVMRFLYGLVLLLIVWLNDPMLYSYPPRDPSRVISFQEMSRIGYTIFTALAWAQGLAIVFLTPAMVAGVIADERQRKTLQYLLASCLSSGEIVVGKFAARLLFTTVLLAIGLPVFVMLSFLGGVDPGYVFLFFATSASTMFFLGSLAIAISTHAKRPREAVSLTYVLELFWFFGPSLLGQFFPWLGGWWLKAYEWIRPVNEWIASSSPFHLMFSLGGGATLFSLVSWMIGLQMAYGVVLLALAVLRLRPTSRREGAAARVTSRSLRFLRRWECGDDGMIWKECLVAKSTLSTQIATAIVFLVVAGMMGYFAYDFLKPALQELLDFGYTGTGQRAREDYNQCLRVILTLLYVCAAIGTASAASNGLSGEREEDTWTSLIASPLTALEILRGKMIGALWSTRWIVLLWLLFAISGVAVGAVHPVGFFAAWALLVTYVMFVCALGTVFSLRARSSSRALTATIGTFIILNGVYLVLNIPLRINSGLIYFGVTPMFEAISLMTYREFDDVFSVLGGFSRYREWELVLATMLSLVFYGGAAVALIWHTLSSFDAVIERPTSGERFAQPGQPVSFDPELDTQAVKAKIMASALQGAPPESPVS